MPDEIQNYPGNSHRIRSGSTEKKAEKKPPIEKIVSGEAVERKRSLSKRVAETFTGDDVQSVGSFVLFEVALPTVKTLISDVVSQGIERLLFGGAPARSSGGTRSHTSYNRMYGGGSSIRKDEPRSISRQARATHDFREVVLPSRGDAEAVIDQLTALIDQYDVATVSDMYQLVGISGTFTEEKWGWTDLRAASVRRIRDGYLLDLPRPMALD